MQIFSCLLYISIIHAHAAAEEEIPIDIVKADEAFTDFVIPTKDQENEILKNLRIETSKIKKPYPPSKPSVTTALRRSSRTHTFSRMTQGLAKSSSTNSEVPNLDVIWYAPILTESGYGSEARDFLHSLHGRVRVRAVQSGDYPSKNKLFLSERMIVGLDQLTQTNLSKSVVVCHTGPDNWQLDESRRNMLPLDQQCPPRDIEVAYKVGRTMFETDRLPDEKPWRAERLNRMDEIWVPTEFSREIFQNHGVHPSKLYVIGESVDGNFFNPNSVTPLDLPRKGYAFLSIGKWEDRKGWEELFVSYFEAFTNKDNVSLHVLTHAYQDSSAGPQNTLEALQKLFNRTDLPFIHVIQQHIETTELPRLYKAVDAFVLPSHGEGWGRPHMEAMSMELPLIATNWSGPTQFMSENNSYPIPIKGLEVVQRQKPFVGHKWASINLTALSNIMKHVSTHPEEGREKGRQARKDVLKFYSKEAIGNQILSRLHAISDIVDVRREEQRKERERLALINAELQGSINDIDQVFEPPRVVLRGARHHFEDLGALILSHIPFFFASFFMISSLFMPLLNNFMLVQQAPISFLQTTQSDENKILKASSEVKESTAEDLSKQEFMADGLALTALFVLPNLPNIIRSVHSFQWRDVVLGVALLRKSMSKERKIPMSDLLSAVPRFTSESSPIAKISRAILKSNEQEAQRKKIYAQKILKDISV